MDIYAKLPDVLAKLIFDYEDRFVLRNGKYMAKLNIYSSRYQSINDMLDIRTQLFDTLGLFMRNMHTLSGIVVLFDKPILDPKCYHLVYCMCGGISLYYCYIPWTPYLIR